ncbi:hypothetical protein LWI28_017832 [Acer negundo]|uniref:Uncharacterized protein n=1 Tax=Acer negundo TaxID=4023 RepID=A0AAD5NFT0_ACENE|nr:hypothetical protein LWI28_017832 [Acer negundo]
MPSNRPEILVLSNQTLSLLVRGYAASKLSSLSRQEGHSSVWGCKIFKVVTLQRVYERDVILEPPNVEFQLYDNTSFPSLGTSCPTNATAQSTDRSSERGNKEPADIPSSSFVVEENPR